METRNVEQVEKKSEILEKAPLSITAFSLLKGVLLCSGLAEWKHLVDPQIASLTQYFFNKAYYKLSNKDQYSLSFLNLFPYRYQNSIFEYKGLKSYPQHCALRKLFFKQQVEQAIQDGATQIVILGAGFCSLATYLQSIYPHVQFFEIDRGDSHEIKKKAVDDLRHSQNKFDFKVGNNLHLLDCDLSNPKWYEVIKGHKAFDKNSKTAVVAEGLLLYLTEAQIKNLFTTIREELFNDDGVIIGNFNKEMKFDTNTRQEMAKRQEEVKFAIDPKDVRKFVNETGFNPAGQLLGTEMHEKAGNTNAVSSQFSQGHFYVFEINKTNNPVEKIPTIELKIPLKKEDLSYNYCTIV